MKQILRPEASAAFFTAAMRCRLEANWGSRGGGGQGRAEGEGTVRHSSVGRAAQLLSLLTALFSTPHDASRSQHASLLCHPKLSPPLLPANTSPPAAPAW